MRNLFDSMASWGNLIIFLASLAILSGCVNVTSLIDKGREEVCLVKDGQYDGGKPGYVNKLADGIKQGAEMAGQELSDDDARQIAEETLKVYCKGAAAAPTPKK